MDDSLIEQRHFSTVQEWRSWLEENHLTKNGIWMIFYKKESKRPGISWSEAVDQALCFGWIDSLKKSVDGTYSIQFFGKRKAKSTWSKINKEKIERFLSEGLVKQAGLDSVMIAKNNGSWSILDDVENLVVPHDLEEALQSIPEAELFFQSLSKSNKKMLLQWLVLAKQEKTRTARIQEILRCAALGAKPKPFI